LKFETPNPKSETSPEFKGQKLKIAPNRAVLDFFPFPPLEFVSGFGFWVSDLGGRQPPGFESAFLGEFSVFRGPVLSGSVPSAGGKRGKAGLAAG
jgi:hypothetical protein